MIQVGTKLKIKENNNYFINTFTYEIASQRLQDRKFVIFDVYNVPHYYDEKEICELFTLLDEDKNNSSSINNGGSTDYYKFKENWNECADIIEDREMNYNQGNIFKSAFCFNIGRHNATDYQRELNKIVYFANRELKRIEKENLF